MNLKKEQFLDKKILEVVIIVTRLRLFIRDHLED